MDKKFTYPEALVSGKAQPEVIEAVERFRNLPLKVRERTSLLYWLLGNSFESFKTPKEDVEYKEKSDKEKCSKCKHIYINIPELKAKDRKFKCFMVEGGIDLSGWCNKWEMANVKVEKPEPKKDNQNDQKDKNDQKPDTSKKKKIDKEINKNKDKENVKEKEETKEKIDKVGSNVNYIADTLRKKDINVMSKNGFLIVSARKEKISFHILFNNLKFKINIPNDRLNNGITYSPTGKYEKLIKIYFLVKPYVGKVSLQKNSRSLDVWKAKNAHTIIIESLSVDANKLAEKVSKAFKKHFRKLAPKVKVLETKKPEDPKKTK